jgi:hypothetical protein
LARHAVVIAPDLAYLWSRTVCQMELRVPPASPDIDARRLALLDKDRRTGLPVIRIGRVITSDDVRSVEDEEP